MARFRLRSLIITLTAALVLSSCGGELDLDEFGADDPTDTPSNSIDEPILRSEPEDGPKLDRVVPHIQQFWTDSYPTIYRGTFQPLRPERIIAAKQGTRVGPCDNTYGNYRDDVEGNAFAIDCREGPMVAYDDAGLFNQLREKFGGLGPAIVMAHEWGHVVQFQARTRLTTVYLEQQADCFAGAWFKNAKATFKELSGAAALDRTVAALLEFRDDPGGSATDPQAHGSGFDRVRAFQEGYERGVKFCAEYVNTPPSLTELPFTTREEAASGGNLAYVEIKDAFPKSLNAYITTVAPKFTGITATTPLAGYTGTCDGKKLAKKPPAVSVCAKEGVIVVDDTVMEELSTDIGDGAVGVLWAVAWGEYARLATGQTRDDGSVGVLFQKLCIAGGWFRSLLDPKADLRFSAGDLDEAIAILAAAAEDGALAEGELFEAIAALRQGVTQGGASCFRAGK